MTNFASFSEWLSDVEIPLGVVLQWIASERGQRNPYEMADEQNAFEGGIETSYSVSQECVDAWRSALQKLMLAIRDGSLPVYGLRNGAAQSEQLPSGAFGRAKAFSPVETEEKMFRSIMEPDISLEFGVYDHSNWRESEGDTIKQNGEVVWSRLAGPIAKVLNIWPLENSVAEYKTGAPGRPSPIQFVEEEARRRRRSGEAFTILKQEAEALNGWCRNTHTKIATPTPTTIENRIRSEHNAWKKTDVTT